MRCGLLCTYPKQCNEIDTDGDSKKKVAQNFRTQGTFAIWPP